MFVEAVTALKDEQSGHAGVIDMMRHGSMQAAEGIAITNVGMAVLGLKYHLKVSD